MSGTPHASFYRADIDGLRAVAVLLVVVFHAWPGALGGGFIGVDVFFVISGFLISTIILKDLEAGRFSFLEFYQRRVLRIFPALLLVLVAVLAVGWFAMSAADFKRLGKSAAGGAGFVSNFIFWKESGYFDAAAESKPLLHLWSLGIEEQFYIVWPLLLWAAFRRKVPAVGLIAGAALLSFAFNVYKANTDPVADFYSPLTRFWELLGGAALAWLAMRRELAVSSSAARANLLAWIGAALLAAGVLLISKDKRFPGAWALLPVLGAFLVIHAGPAAMVNRVLAQPVLVWIGKISYPLYLWHWPLLCYGRMVGGELSAAQTAGLVVAAVVLAALTYHLVEKPIRFGAGRRGRKSAWLAVLVAAAGATGYAFHKLDGLLWRYETEQQKAYRLQAQWPESWNATPECNRLYRGEQYCMIGDANRPPDAALIGDSHANHFYFGLEESLRRRSQNLLMIGAGGCPPFFGIDRGKHPQHGNLNCLARTQAFYKNVLESPSIRTVYLAFHHSEYFRKDVEFIDREAGTTPQPTPETLLAPLVRTIQAFEARGKQVVLIYDLPELDRDIAVCLAGGPVLSRENKACPVADIRFSTDFADYDRLLQAVTAQTRARIFDTRPYLRGNFPVNPQGVLTYRDNSHLSRDGSLFFADKYP